MSGVFFAHFRYQERRVAEHSFRFFRFLKIFMLISKDVGEMYADWIVR